MEKLNIEVLLSSKEFTNQVNQIANLFNVGYNEDIKDDVRQACAIAAWVALQKYDAVKTNGNFWGYAYLRMREYAKREVYKQRNVVHIPMNRTTEWAGCYAKKGVEDSVVVHTYESLTWDDGHDKMFDTVSNDIATAMDIETALATLDEETRYIFEVHAELKEGYSGKSDYTTLSKELGIPTYVVRQRFNAARTALAELLG